MPKRSITRLLLLFSIAFLFVASGLGVYWLLHHDWHRRSVLVDGEHREYLWYEPSTRSITPKPLIFAYHGFSGTADRMRKSSLLHDLVDKHGFYLAYIEGDPTWHCFTPWETGKNPDIAMFDQLRSKLLAKYPIDAKRVYAVGISKGGDFVVHLGLRRSAELAGIVSQGACIFESQIAEHPQPLLFIVGTEDGEVLPETMDTVPQEYRNRGHSVQVIRPEGGKHRWDRSLNDELWEFLSKQSLGDVDQSMTMDERPSGEPANPASD